MLQGVWCSKKNAKGILEKYFIDFMRLAPYEAREMTEKKYPRV
jgi:hypothetical protein